ncbi:unnamed protein product [Phytophthora fragariaefolia]|uniref:Unnamed protein product n=1 Tax=Phytophthora fragariaefolia TaxID=1490495 RepID=A0A9W6U319_9STRA|nr:unnamed protein product [Phytophthora fragariaefolia]
MDPIPHNTVNKEAMGRQLSSEVTSNSATKGVKRSLPVSKAGGTPTIATLPSRQPSPPKPWSSDETVESIMKSKEWSMRRSSNSPSLTFRCACLYLDCFDLDFEPQPVLCQASATNLSDTDLLLLKDNVMEGMPTEFGADDLFNDLASAISPHKSICGLGGQQTFELAEISDFSPDWDFRDGGAKILICLATKLPKRLAQDPMKLFVQFGAKRVRAEKVSDTVLRCTAPSSRELGTVDIYVCHWSGSLQQASIQLSHKKQFTYRSHYQISRSLVGEIVKERCQSDAAAIDPLELSVPHSANGISGKRGRSPTVVSRNVSGSKGSEDRLSGFNRNLSSYVESDRKSVPCLPILFNHSLFSLFSLMMYLVDERQCKIRVVERLSEFHQAIRTKAVEPMAKDTGVFSTASGSSSGEKGRLLEAEQNASLPSKLPSSSLSSSQVQHPRVSDMSTEPPGSLVSSNGTSIALDDCTIETLSDNDLEQLSEKLLERVVRQLVTVAHTSEELLDELNSLDETGLSLLHYVSFYNYSQLVPVLVAHGAHINQQSTQGQTALHLAAGCGHDGVVDVLLQSGADLQVRDFDGLTAADRAEKSGHTDVAAKLHRHMGEKSSSDLGAVNETYGFEGSPMEIDDAPTPYMDAGDMGLLEGNSAGHTTRRRESSVGDEILVSPSSSTGTSVGFGSSPASMVGTDNNLVGGRLMLSGAENDSDVQSVIAEDEEGLNKLQAAMELMGPEEKQSLEDEVKVLQHGIRAWLLKRNCKNMRETTKQLREATQNMEDQQKQQEAVDQRSMLASELSERERAAVTVQAATRSMLARRSFLQTKHVAIKFQAATRGVLCRKNFARMKAHALASLVIQRNVREWWNKQPGATRPGSIDKISYGEDKCDTEEEKEAISPDAYEQALRDVVQRHSHRM